MSSDKEKYGLSVRKARRKKELTQAQLGKLIGISKNSIGNIEKGRQNPTPKHRRMLEEVLGEISDEKSNRIERLKETLRELTRMNADLETELETLKKENVELKRQLSEK
jgi:DNA-binding XRE family transcriptional regulator